MEYAPLLKNVELNSPTMRKLNVKEMAAKLGIHEKTMANRLRVHDDAPTFKEDNRIYAYEDAFDNWVAKHPRVAKVDQTKSRAQGKRRKKQEPQAVAVTQEKTRFGELAAELADALEELPEGTTHVRVQLIAFDDSSSPKQIRGLCETVDTLARSFSAFTGYVETGSQ